jgi:hypothetical protein
MLDPEELYIDGKLWGAKDNRFWCLLSTLLIKTEPTSILEIGAGRSTTFFSEYAVNRNIPFVSIEQSIDWYREIHRSLRFMFLPGSHIRHIPIDHESGWYDYNMAFEAIGDTAYDMILIDGPTGRSGRRNQRGNDILELACRKSRMVIIDDTHRDECLSFANHICDRRQFQTIADIKYQQRRKGVYDSNMLTIATSEWSDIVKERIQDIYGTDSVTFLSHPSSRR